jgi:hypothetical protein
MLLLLASRKLLITSALLWFKHLQFTMIVTLREVFARHVRVHANLF